MHCERCDAYLSRGMSQCSQCGWWVPEGVWDKVAVPEAPRRRVESIRPLGWVLIEIDLRLRSRRRLMVPEYYLRIVRVLGPDPSKDYALINPPDILSRGFKPASDQQPKRANRGNGWGTVELIAQRLDLQGWEALPEHGSAWYSRRFRCRLPVREAS